MDFWYNYSFPFPPHCCIWIFSVGKFSCAKQYERFQRTRWLPAVRQWLHCKFSWQHSYFSFWSLQSFTELFALSLKRSLGLELSKLSGSESSIFSWQNCLLIRDVTQDVTLSSNVSMQLSNEFLFLWFSWCTVSPWWSLLGMQDNLSV